MSNPKVFFDVSIGGTPAGRIIMELMPERRKFPFNILPRAGAHLSITFGEPIPAEELFSVANSKESSEDIIRSKLTDIVRRRVELLGRSVSGLTLGQTKAP